MRAALGDLLAPAKCPLAENDRGSRRADESIQDESIRGENIRGENIRGENIQGENIRGKKETTQNNAAGENQIFKKLFPQGFPTGELMEVSASRFSAVEPWLSAWLVHCESRRSCDCGHRFLLPTILSASRHCARDRTTTTHYPPARIEGPKRCGPWSRSVRCRGFAAVHLASRASRAPPSPSPTARLRALRHSWGFLLRAQTIAFDNRPQSRTRLRVTGNRCQRFEIDFCRRRQSARASLFFRHRLLHRASARCPPDGRQPD